MSTEGAKREEARAGIIAAVDVDSMIACATVAQQMADQEDAEFWWFEVATVPSGDDQITRGVMGLCDNVLVPQGRFEEAELYCRHLLTRSSPFIQQQTRNMLDLIESQRRIAGVPRLVNEGEWRHIDVTEPVQAGLSQQQAYDRMYAIVDARNSDGHMDAIANATRDDFMPFVTGWIIGASPASECAGLKRETLVKVLADWLTERGCQQLASAPTGLG